MRALTTDENLAYSTPPPILVVADSDRARARAEATIARSNYRIAPVSVTEAPNRLRGQAAASALWLELDRDPGEALLPLLAQIRTDVDEGRYAAVAAAGRSLDGPLAAAIAASPVRLVIDGSEAERCEALAAALSGAHNRFRLSDSAVDPQSERLRQLSDEVGRIASTLSRLSSDTARSGPEQASEADPETLPVVSVDTVRAVIAARRLRAHYLPDDLFADPAWDMLLDLFHAELAQWRVPVSSLCIAAAVPATTALRWLKTMTDRELLVRRPDPHDGRRVFVELAPDVSLALRRYFAEIGRPEVV